jgi:FlaA1/EpsC-like NDP-sugar epimerase
MKRLNKGLLNLLLTLMCDILFVFLVAALCSFGSFNVEDLTLTQIWGLVSYSASFAVLLCFSFWLFGVYRLLIDNFGMIESVKIAIIVLCDNLVAYLIMFFVPNGLLPSFKISVAILGAVVMVFLCDALRTGKRLLKFLVARSKKSKIVLKRTLVIGAGAAAKIVIDDTRNNIESRSHVLVLVDDSVDKIGRTFSGIPVVGPISEVSKFIEMYQIDEVIIAIEDLHKDRLSQILSYMRDADVQIRRLPILSELGSVNQKAVLNVDINEILGREIVKLDNSEITGMLHGKCVLVTGAGGSIGSELVRQIFKTHPSTLVLFDIYENGVYSIQQELIREIKREDCTDVNLITLIGSTYNEIRMEQIFSLYKPDYVYHAAAYKHVPLMEESPVEAIRTNVIGTYNVAKLCGKYGVKKMLLISTDKAVRPTNAMGATKRFAEMIVQYFSSISKSTKYCAVRFGNVLGSNGSVIPLFEKQIEEGGPITVTDPNIIRFFMTIPEAVGFILQSSIYAAGGEIFILDMGKPVKIDDLAKKMIRQAGFIPNKDINIVYSGLRPGEKLYEETLIDPTTQIKTANDKIFIEKPGLIQPIEQDIAFISQSFEIEKTPNDVKGLLHAVVDTYYPEMNN